MRIKKPQIFGKWFGLWLSITIMAYGLSMYGILKLLEWISTLHPQ